MGQTLTHGVYLPDEGERNCYDGLASNWSILDGAVGTVAEHTSQIAGKAPAVHTHTKSDITDFPVYGNAAGTICEGNDSRLSDARTPVAHTHGKADITGLFNSANTWTDHNTYTKYIYMRNSSIEIGNAPSNNASKEITFTDKNNATLSRVLGKAESSGNSYIALHATNKFTNGTLDPNGTSVDSYFFVGIDETGNAYNIHKGNTYPQSNNSYNLGTSVNQWKSVYAQSYYYNGVAFTDKFVTTDTEQTITKTKTFNIDNNQVPDIYHNTSSGFSRYRTRGSSNLRNYDSYLRWAYTSYDNYIVLNRSAGVYGSTTEGETVDDIDTSFNLFKIHIRYKAFDLVDAVKATNDGTENSLKPITNNATDLGTSTNKWKTLNGVNPGALSLPGAYLGINDQIKNPSDQLNAIDLNGGSNTWISDVDCYLYFYIPNNKFTWIRIFWPSTLVRCGQTFVPVPNESSDYSGFVPVPANTTVVIQVKGTQAPIFRRSACLGNV